MQRDDHDEQRGPHAEHREETHWRCIGDELDLIAAVLGDIEDDSIRDRVTMWVDYALYRSLYGGGADDDDDHELTRGCRKALLEHLDEVAAHVVSEQIAHELIAAPSPSEASVRRRMARATAD